ncbi:hypothetical protein RD110_08665 [Rhodoferax koreense]|uniref:UspA domain-containing protein n=1 Tax=Rhodoferax koreensis TaxID=1842727 RepID=A0A1P8JU14_9BURK|nr:universal stress protein [Rhodoferax koreense]APW37259.1 hypothetical protein RD110_08665 [Rhodoferax koreense]
MADIQSILVHLDSSERCAERIRVAQRLAESFDATAIGVYAVVPSLLRHPMGLDGMAGAMGLQEYDDECRARACRLWSSLAGTSARMRWTASPGDSIWNFESRAFYADLLLLGQRDEADAVVDETPADFVFHQVARSGRPVMVLPSAGSFDRVGETVLIAWKETREAAHAVAAALPWLRKARQVHAISYAEDEGASLNALHDYLARHGVAIIQHASQARDVAVGEDLLSRAADIGADLLVMGCYGHSRARELVLGGVSRTILRSMTLPVLMAH